MLHLRKPLPRLDVTESSEYHVMQTLLEQKAQDIAFLQRQVENLQNSLEAMISNESSPPEVVPSSPEVKPSSLIPARSQSSAEQHKGSVRSRNLPKRITVTLNDHVHQKLIERSMAEGRSVSNLAAYILEAHLEPLPFHD